MQFFVSEVHYAILLYSYNFFLLRSLIFSLNVKQLLQNSCEIIIFPNDIKFQNYLLINPFEFLQSRANSNSQEPPPLQSWADYCISHPSFPCKWALDGEVHSSGKWHFVAFQTASLKQKRIKIGHMCKSSGNPVSRRGIWINSNIQSGSALDFSRTKASKTWNPT